MRQTLTPLRVTIVDKPVFEKNVPVPAQGTYAHSKYYWVAEMEIGDSFTCSHKYYSQVRNVTAHKGKPVSWLPDGFKIATRKVGNDLYRIWRIA